MCAEETKITDIRLFVFTVIRSDNLAFMYWCINMQAFMCVHI